MTQYVIYHVETTLLAPLKRNVFWKESQAKAAITRGLNNGHIHNREDWAIAEWDDFKANIEIRVRKKNLMSGKWFTVAVNTPAYMDPSCESYWSM